MQIFLCKKLLHQADISFNDLDNKKTLQETSIGNDSVPQETHFYGRGI
jgi:hypothetical protein